MPKQDPTKKSPETAEHKRLKAVLKEILGISGFKFDTEISLNFSGSLDPKGQLVAALMKVRRTLVPASGHAALQLISDKVLDHTNWLTAIRC